MNELISQSEVKAQKDYVCNASEYITECDPADMIDLTFSEKKAIIKARRNKWKVKKGDIYIRQVGKYDGELYTFKAIPAIHAICLKYDLYGEQL